MSYGISVRGATKALAIAALTAKFESDVTANQPVHAKDAADALAAAESFVNQVRDPRDGEEVAISLSGSLSWTGGSGTATEEGGEDVPQEFYNASVSVSVSVCTAVPVQ